jgi:DNA/RNA-binding domain of Phe-tRNA-synthetase-like protein
LRDGWVDAELAAEFPELGLRYTELGAGSGRTPEGVKERLRSLSNRFTGGHVVEMRQDPVPWAYRVFFRQVGMDPDTVRTPVEAAALERLRAGGFRSSDLLSDAMLIATVETGVPVVAFDARRVGAQLGLRLAHKGEMLAGGDRPLSTGQLVIADEDRSLAVLFGEVADGRDVGRETTRTLLASAYVKGVPAISVEEALWTAADIVQSAA